MTEAETQIQDDPLAPMRRKIALTRAAIAAERGARAFWPLIAVVLLVLALVRSGALPILGDLLGGAVVLGVGAVALIGTLGYGLWRFRVPGVDAAVGRLDLASDRRVLSALADRPAGDMDAAQAAVWQAHRARMRALAEGLRPPRPDL
ncbi:DUF4175 family protein, partial [Roseobacter sp. HKCCA0434]|uniref:DUF4175 family protein n=1 Tax=Roseobacter sp. HKCCA0434 TaxID=3079297 RepID=UPI002905DE2A